MYNMADSNNWKTSIKATERFENIEKIQKLAPQINAFSIEVAAFQNSNSKEEYLHAINLAVLSPGQQLSSPTTQPAPAPSPPDYLPSTATPGKRIGPHQSCHYIASGITSEVYRTSDSTIALKVIINTNIPPHNPRREAKILESLSHKNIIPLLGAFADPLTSDFVLSFPYQPSALSSVPLPLSPSLVLPIFTSLFSALSYLHSQSIIHRDVKPSAVLLSANYQVCLSDFGTAWHPALSASDEPARGKILDVGTGPYRAPETLFGNAGYGPEVDIWAAGCTLAECLTGETLFTCPPGHEDGNQLALISSIFRTLGTPTRETWPEAEGFNTPPFNYMVYEGKKWEELLKGVEEKWKGVVQGCIKYESRSRMKAEEVVRLLEGWNDETGSSKGSAPI